MPRSESEERKKKKLKYTSAKAMAEKAEAGYQATYLKVPKGFKLYKPKAGKAILDIIPFIAGAGNPNAEEGEVHWERTFWTHRGIGPNQETFLCPAKTSNSKCPICEARMQMAESEEDDDEKMRKSLLPKQRQLFNIIDRKNPDAGVQLLDMSSFLFGDVILETIQSADEGENWDLFFTLDEGMSLRVVWSEEKFGGHSFLKAGRIDFKEREEAYDEDILEKAACLDEILVEMEYKELKKRFLAVKAKDEDEDEEEEDTDTEVDEEEKEDEAPKKKKKSKPVEEEDEEEDESEDEEEEDEEEEEEEEPPKKKKKKPVDDEEEEDEEDESEEEEEDEEPPKKKKKKPVDDEEEEDEAEEEDEEEDEPPKKKKKVKDEEEEEEDESEEDEDWEGFDEDEPKKKKKAKSKSED